MKFVIGLAEPSDSMLGSRGNVGAMVIDALIEKHGLGKLKTTNTFNDLEINEYIKGRSRVMIAKANLSPKDVGPLVRKVCEAYKIAVGDVIVIQDDIDAPLGELKLRDSGGDGGHDGVRSVAMALPAKTFMRVRVGVGRGAKGKSKAQYLGEIFPLSDTGKLLSSVYKSAAAVDYMIENGLRAAQKIFHHPDEKNGIPNWVADVPAAILNPISSSEVVAVKNPIPRDAITSNQQHPKDVFLDQGEETTGTDDQAWHGSTVPTAMRPGKLPIHSQKLLPAHTKKRIEVQQVAGPSRPMGNGAIKPEPTAGTTWPSFSKMHGFGMGDPDNEDLSEFYYPS